LREDAWVSGGDRWWARAGRPVSRVLQATKKPHRCGFVVLGPTAACQPRIHRRPAEAFRILVAPASDFRFLLREARAIVPAVSVANRTLGASRE
jgi:hypothetical protein